MLPASMAPSAPAPTIMCISSINNIISPFESLISFRTFLRRSSNSPRYLAPAIRAPKSRDHILLPFKVLGTSPFTIRMASPSTIAVLPTPGSPIKTGLFFVFLDRIRIILRISSSLPITGSTLFFLTASVISRPYFSKTFSFSSPILGYILTPSFYYKYNYIAKISTCQV